MITKYQSDIENNHVRGIATYTPPAVIISISSVALTFFNTGLFLIQNP